jgi:hypothetical protein
VDIKPDVEHGCLLKSLYLGNAATVFQVTRLTEASFIVSTPKPIDPIGLNAIQLRPRFLPIFRTKFQHHHRSRKTLN